MKEYFKIIELKSELSKSPLILPYGINSFFTFKPSKITLAQVICITYSVQFFGQFLTSPTTRACHQTNSSEGGFVRKVPSTFFIFFLYFSFIIFFFCPPLFSLFSLCPFLGGPWTFLRVTIITNGRGGVVCFRLFNWKKNDYKLLRKVSTITV